MLDHPALSSRYFFPRPDEPPDVWKVHDRGVTLHCWRRESHPGAPWLLHFHGNGELVADYVPGFADALADLGWNAAFAEYRGYGGSSGTPTIPAMLEDAESVFTALAVPPERVVVYGRSVGSYPAIELAQRHPDLGGLVLESGIADPLERIRMRVTAEELGATEEELEAEVARLADHRAKLATYRGRLLVLHAAHDSMVDASHAERMYEWAASSEDDKRIALLPEGDHNNVMSANADEYWDELAAFLALVADSAG
jgi:pimeloyl-ACP methyl ester carboxylesterase